MKHLKDKSKDSLTSRQKEIYNFIVNVIKNKGIPPTIREIGEAVALASSSSVHCHLLALEKRGLIKRNSSKSRSIEVTGTQMKTQGDIVWLPLVVRIAAQANGAIYKEITDNFPLSGDWVGSRDAFIFPLDSQNMHEAGMLSNDWCIVQPQSEALDGDIVVALVDNNATVRKYYKGSGFIRLEAADHRLRPIIVREAIILGKVIGIIRKL